jgi:hypothetical protein
MNPESIQPRSSPGPAAAPRCCVHIGLPKSATTLLQDRFFPVHDQIEYLGKTSSWRFPPGQLGEILADIFERRLEPGRCALERSRFATHIGDACDGGARVPVWSLEILGAGLRRNRLTRARLIRDIMGPARILVVLRHPLELLESYYFERLKAAQISDFHFKAMQRGTYLDIDSWLTRRLGGRPVTEAIHVLDYAHTLKLYSDLFGQPSVGVFLYERLASQPERFIGEVCRFLGITPTDETAGAGNHRVYTRWTEAHVDSLRRISESPLRRWLFRRQSLHRRRSMLGLDDEAAAEAPMARARIAPHWREQVEDATREGHRWIAETWGLPLEQHGYPF